MNAPESLYLRQARQHVTDFDRESTLLRDHKEAMDCWDVDAILQMGIDAFGWIIQADNLYRKLLYDGRFAESTVTNVEDFLGVLFAAWLRSCESVNKRISEVQQRGYDLENLANFRKCEREVQAILRHYNDVAQDHVLPDSLTAIRDEALVEHSNGQTAEFISEEE